MGIDLLDIGFRIERAFGIRLSQDDLVRRDANGNLRGPTAGDLLATIIERTTGRAPAGQTLRNSLRQRIDRVLAVYVGSQIGSADESLPLGDLIPVCDRREAWLALEADLRVPLPRLKRPLWASRLIAVGCLWTVIGIPVGTAVGGLFPTAVGSSFGSAAVASFTAVVTLPWRLRFPNYVGTLRDLMNTLLAVHSDRLCASLRQWREDDAWDVLRAILVDILGVAADQVTRDARVFEDLGAE